MSIVITEDADHNDVITWKHFPNYWPSVGNFGNNGFKLLYWDPNMNLASVILSEISRKESFISRSVQISRSWFRTFDYTNEIIVFFVCHQIRPATINKFPAK